MAKIGKKPISIPENIEVEVKKDEIVFQDKKGRSLKVPILSGIEPKLEQGNLVFTTTNKNKQTKSNWGTLRSLCNNAIIGLNSGFEKILEIKGLGYKAKKEGNKIILQLGFSHPIEFSIPEDIEIEVERENIIRVKGIDKNRVGEIASKLRRLREPEPYKGKGIRYQGEFIRMKAGKKAVSKTSV